MAVLWEKTAIEGVFSRNRYGPRRVIQTAGCSALDFGMLVVHSREYDRNIKVNGSFYNLLTILCLFHIFDIKIKINREYFTSVKNRYNSKLVVIQLLVVENNHLLFKFRSVISG